MKEWKRIFNCPTHVQLKSVAKSEICLSDLKCVRNRFCISIKFHQSVLKWKKINIFTNFWKTFFSYLIVVVNNIRQLKEWGDTNLWRDFVFYIIETRCKFVMKAIDSFWSGIKKSALWLQTTPKNVCFSGSRIGSWNCKPVCDRKQRLTIRRFVFDFSRFKVFRVFMTPHTRLCKDIKSEEC